MPPLGLRRLLFVPLLTLLIGNLAADAITGRVVDGNGVGVAGVDIDFINLGSGGNPHERNDGTDANGNFLTTVDAGVYEVRFYPPVPPATTLLTGVVSSVTVIGTKNLGTITLAPGVLLKGTALNSSNQPVAGVKCDVFDAATRALYPLKNNLSNAFGLFQVAVPAKAIDVHLLTASVVTQLLAPRLVNLSVSGTTDLGNLVFQPGLHLAGTVKTEAGFPVAGANVDVADSTTGEKLLTPGDNTTSSGGFDVVVPAGLWDIDVARPTSQVLVGINLNNVIVSAATNLGVLTMRNGVFLSGKVRDRSGALVAGADVNVYELATGHSLSLGLDNTNATGSYSVVVPTGLMKVVFSPPGPHNVWQKDYHRHVDVTGDATLDGRLPGAPSGAKKSNRNPPGAGSRILSTLHSAGGTAGAFGVPHLRKAADAGGSSTALLLESGLPGATVEVFLGVETQPLALSSPIQIVQPLVRLALQLDDSGSARIDLPRGALASAPAFVQVTVIDASAESGLALSPIMALEITP